MEPINIGILHPGEMGVSIAASARNGGHTLYWASQGRSAQTRQRAEAQQLTDIGSLAEMCTACQMILSVCPPHAAEQVVSDVIAAGFRGLFLDANAIAPERTRRLGRKMQSAGIDFVDGGIIGGPAWQKGETWLYLSGKSAQAVADVFSAGPLATAVIGEQIGKASALKMLYAAYSKGTTALLSAILAAAEQLEVSQELVDHWERDEHGFAIRAQRRARRVTAKAWRFAGEMQEIAETLESAGLPGGFHRAAGEIYTRMAQFKDLPEPPELAEVLASLVKGEE